MVLIALAAMALPSLLSLVGLSTELTSDIASRRLNATLAIEIANATDKQLALSTIDNKFDVMFSESSASSSNCAAASPGPCERRLISLGYCPLAYKTLPSPLTQRTIDGRLVRILACSGTDAATGDLNCQQKASSITSDPNAPPANPSNTTDTRIISCVRNQNDSGLALTIFSYRSRGSQLVRVREDSL